MEERFNIAANLIVKLFDKFGETEIMNQYRKNERKILSDAHNCDFQSNFTEELQIKDISKCLSYLFAIDYICATDSFRLKYAFNDKALNSEYRDKVEIYFTYSQQIRHGNSASDNISFLFKNLIFFVKNINIFKNMKIQNIYINEKVPIIRLAYIPYPRKCSDIYQDECGYLKFTARTTINSNDNQFLNQCQEAVYKYNCNIIFGPEIHGSPPLDKKLKEFCCNNGSKVIICPSYYSDKDGEKFNQTTIYTFNNNKSNGLTIKKSFPARFKDYPPEEIAENNDFTIALIHINSFGKIAVLICKDYLTKNLNNLVELLNIDLLIVQSFSDKTSDFISRMEYNASNKQCVVLGNSCYITYNSENEIAFPLILSKFNYKHSKHDKNTQTTREACRFANNCLNTKCKMMFELTVINENLHVKRLYTGE